VPVVADPALGVDYHRYRGCTSITPNRTETGRALGRKIATAEQGLEAARDLLAFGVQSAVVTLDREGIAWWDARGPNGLFPVKPRQVFDITGAGDMVLAALGYGLAAGADWPMAIELANLAGGAEVERLGVAPLSRRELLAELSGGYSSDHKIVSLEQAEEELDRRRRKGQRIVMTNGCFDLLHPGHVASLQYARNQGDCLVVGLNSDRSIRLLKGPGHPIIAERDRAEMLGALACVDYVVVFEAASVEGLVRRLAPDVLVKSAQYAPEEVVGYESVRRRGGTVALAPMKGDYSTSGLIERIRNMGDPSGPDGGY
jgi:D-beta-D-heptose 7-phosphate kinase/D-beta-D-heptose 1-phosphate adenosyltransferase